MRVPLEIRGLFNSLAENKTPQGRLFAMQNASTDRGILEARKGYARIGKRPNWNAADVCWGLGYGKFACNETQALQVTGNPTGGTVVVRSPIQGATNSLTIPFNAYPSDIQTAVAGFTAFDDGEFVFSGGPWPNETMYVTYKGRYADAPQALLTLQTNSLTGGTLPTLAISHFVNGGPSEGYLVVVQPSGAGTSTLYWVTSSDGFATTIWTQAATGLTSSDWFFQQFGDKIYAVNATDGLTWYQIGGSWHGTAGISGIQNPVTQPSAPSGQPWAQNTDQINFHPQSFNFHTSTFTFPATTPWGTNPTIAIGGASNDILTITLNHALAGDQVNFDINLSDHPEDWSHQDYVFFQITSDPSKITFISSGCTLALTDETGAIVTKPTFEDSGDDNVGATSATYTKRMHFGSDARSARSATKTLTVTFQVPLGTSGQSFAFRIWREDTWPNDQMDRLDITAGATSAAIEYAYSYVKASSGGESKLSPVGKTPVIPASGFVGNNVHVACSGSSQLTAADFINLYRKDRFGLWRLVGQKQNVTAGTQGFIDTNMLDEMDGYPVFGTIHLPGGQSPTVLGIFKQSLVVGADRKVWLSEVGQPLVYAPDPENLAAQSTIDPTDIDHPRTTFMATNRAESVVTIVGQDSLYLSGETTSYAMTNGDRPSELSPPRILPGSRGCIGARAAFTKSGGAAIAAKDGLWYYAVSSTFTGTIATGTIIEQELTVDVRTSYAQVLGSSYAGAIVIAHQEEDYVFNGKQYLKFTRNKQIEQGTFADSVKAAFSSSSNGLVAAASDGSLIRFGVGSTDDVTPIRWSAATGIIDGQRSRIKGIEVQFDGTPSVKLESWDGDGGYDSQEFDLVDGKVNHYPAEILLQGYRYRFTFSGSGTDAIEAIAIVYEAAPGGKGN